ALSDRVVVLDRGRVVAQGSVSQIRAHVGQRRIRCVSALAAAQVLCWPGVRAATRDGDRLEIVAETAEPVVRRLLDADPLLQDLEVLRAGLADAFIQITAEEEAA
ncbi:MAG: ABC transporter ATP-binding protein, partial [Lysobacterales bacterium]